MNLVFVITQGEWDIGQRLVCVKRLLAAGSDTEEPDHKVKQCSVTCSVCALLRGCICLQ